MNFENLAVWQRATGLSVATYKAFAMHKDYGFKDQITRASLSIASNISEGMERQTSKEKCQFLYIAKGSCGELRTQLYIAKEINYLERSFADNCISETTEISKMLMGLINKIRES
ncbi:four helix bundle protein [Thalassotalea sp. PLHSN55]|uniref:four helix bundle protein n=1 Tax=Thalassotalea sp. PLHSN55 TaxID=3435888 RepID=UPI003F857F64